MRRSALFVSAFAVLLVSSARYVCGEEHSVEASLAAFGLADPNLVIEPVATEPDVVDPVAVAWDEDERMYVVEMRDYPSGPGKGTIRRLEDADGDGRYENAVIFADGLSFPSSCLPWRGGLLVTAAPDILYLKDTDGDGRADERRVVLTGFAEGDQQLRVNGLTFGLDGWVYAANGRNGGDIRAADAPQKDAVSIRRNDLRLMPDTGIFETVSGPSQFGLARDDWGNRFLSWNTIPIRHVVIEDRYLNRGGSLQGESGIATMIPGDDTGRVYPLAPSQRRFNRESADFFNASCGTTIYRGEALPGLQGDAFACESLSSLVHQRRLVRDGATFAASRVQSDSEFLASKDAWFRPVNLATGPDGGLYVVDFCRQWVEHPDFIPKELQTGIDFRAGDNLGRIWRIRPKGNWAPRARKRISAATTAELTECLRDPNGWRRDQAQRLLIEREDKGAVPLLGDLVRHGATPQTRLAALWTLAALERHGCAIDEELIRDAMRHASPEVRRGAIEVVEPRLRSGGCWEAELLGLAEDKDAAVQLQTALAAGFMEKEARSRILRKLASGGRADGWVRMAIMSSLGGGAPEFLTSLLKESPDTTGAESIDAEMLGDLARVAAAQPGTNAARATIIEILRSSRGEDAKISLLAGFLGGLEPRGAAFDKTLGTGDPDITSAIAGIVATAKHVSTSSSAATGERVRAIRVLAVAPKDEAEAIWSSLLDARQPPEVRVEAARELGRHADAAQVERLLGAWEQIPTSSRSGLLQELSRRADSVEALLAAAEGGRISRIELRGAAGESLMSHPDTALRSRAEELFNSAGGENRAEVIARYQKALGRPGDARRGAKQFARNCVACHRVQGLGQTVGPDLSGIASRPKEKLVSDVLDPSAEVAPDFMNYILTTRSGEVYSGLLVRETLAGVTLRQAQGAESTVARAQVAEFRAGNASLMPEGFEEALDEQAMADLLEFLHHGDRRALEEAIQADSGTMPR